MPGQRMHADELAVDVGLVRRLVAAQLPQWAALPLTPVPSAGTINALFRLGDDMVARLPRVEWGVKGVEREHEWLPRLAPHLPVAIPALLGKGSPGAGYPWPWSVFRWLEGENPMPGRIAEPRSLATALAEFVVALRHVDLTDAPTAYRGVPLATRDPDVRRCLAELRGVVDTDAATAAWDEALRSSEWPGPPVWVHSDLMPGNLLVVEGRLSGVIDFAAAGVGDPACDLMPAWNLLPAAARGAFRDGLEVDEATWSRGRGWALSQALIALPYYSDTNRAMADNARHVIHEVIAEREGAA